MMVNEFKLFYFKHIIKKGRQAPRIEHTSVFC